MLYGREQEEQQIQGLIASAEAGRSAALVIVAEPGGGKSALLRRAGELVDGSWQVLSCTGIESESELPFAGLQLLLSPVLAGLDAMPAPQKAALRAAFGLGTGDGVGTGEPADRFLVGLATQSLLTELAADASVLCLVDDAQWLDQPSADALLFAARRLGADKLVLLFAGREEFAAPGLTELRLPRLDPAAARVLLAERLPDLASDIRDRVLAEAGGNPLALLELPSLEIDSLSVGPLPLPHRLQEAYQRRVTGLAEPVRTALLVAAALETGSLGTVLEVMDGLGLTAAVLAEGERCGLLTVSADSIAFRHPLMRAAAYQAAPFTVRLAMHAAIADALGEDPDRAAWHRAAATTGPDESVAAALETAADHARARTGYATAVAALERAARLSPEGRTRVRRLVSATETAADAGQPDRARRLADQAQADHATADPAELARLASVRARVEFEFGSLRQVHELLVSAADPIASSNPVMAAVMLADAARASWNAGDAGRVEETYRGLLELPPDPFRDALAGSIEGVLKLASGEAEAGVALIRELVAAGRDIQTGMPSLRLNVALQAMLAGDLEDARAVLLALVDECRKQGMVGWLPAALCTLASAEFLSGRLRDAAVFATEGLRIAEDTGQPNRIAHGETVLALVAARSGDELRCRELAERNLRYYAECSNTVDAFFCEWALATLDLGLGRYEAALDRLEAASRGPVRFVGNTVLWTSADQVEAAIRLGRPDRAAGVVASLEQWVDAVNAPGAQAVLSRCQALLDRDGEAYARAVELHAGTPRPYDRGRTALVYGEWLRRERRQTEARTHLRDALEIFDRLGAVPWAEHARAELRAAGEGSGTEPETDLANLLTPQELQVVRLASTGATNKEIGAQLFLSPKTVGHHLYRAFPKLGVSTRVELARLRLT